MISPMFDSDKFQELYLDPLTHSIYLRQTEHVRMEPGTNVGLLMS